MRNDNVSEKGQSATGVVLILDTCGERASLCLCQGRSITVEVVLEERTASSALLRTIRHVMQEAGLGLRDLAAVGVVNGPGSFTGLRVGLAIAKGLCEALDVPIAAVSRLAVLAHAGELTSGLAVLRAGRNEVYVGEFAGASLTRGSMMTEAELRALTPGAEMVYAEASLSVDLAPLGARLLPLSARHAMSLVVQALQDGNTELSTLDANYVRHEQAIYARQQQGRA